MQESSNRPISKFFGGYAPRVSKRHPKKVVATGHCAYVLHSGTVVVQVPEPNATWFLIDAERARDRSMIEKGTESAELKVEERVVSEVRTLEAFYSTEFERRLTELAAVLNTQLEARVEAVRVHYQEQYQSLQQQAAQPAQFSEAVPSASEPSTPSKQILEELERVEASARECAATLERMVADDGVPMGKLLQLRNQEVELKAYIRGLKFNIGSTTSAASK
jgi:hypothetical protein